MVESQYIWSLARLHNSKGFAVQFCGTRREMIREAFALASELDSAIECRRDDNMLIRVFPVVGRNIVRIPYIDCSLMATKPPMRNEPGAVIAMPTRCIAVPNMLI